MERDEPELAQVVEEFRALPAEEQVRRFEELPPEGRSALYNLLKQDRLRQFMEQGWAWMQYVTTQDEAEKVITLKPFPQKPYLERLWELVQSAPIIVVAKSRRMMLTWLLSLYGCWRARFRDNQLVMIQSETEDKAAFVTDERCFFVEDHLPPFLKTTIQTHRTQKGLIGRMEYGNGSKIWAIPQGGDVIRTYTPSLLLTDEAAFQPDFELAWKAALPTVEKGSQLLAVSTPNGPNYFKQVYGTQKHEFVEHLPGLRSWQNELGYLVIEVHYRADEEKRPGTEAGDAWYRRERPKYDQGTWDQEYEISFVSAKGRRVFGLFNRHTHVQTLSAIRYRRIYRAWDFGALHPCLLFAQLDGRDRLLILKELFGPRPGREVEDIEGWAEYVLAVSEETWPDWAAGFVDVCDPAGAQRKPLLTARGDQTELAVLNRYGIYPTYRYARKEEGRVILQRLLKTRQDESPGLLIDPSCSVLTEGLEGGYVFTDRGEPKDDGYYEHPIDCMHYLAISCFSLAGDVVSLGGKSGSAPPKTEYHWGNRTRRGY